ncbi:MAG: hypothetical protein ACLFQJ_01585 [Campylobacterales bacterium]
MAGVYFDKESFASLIKHHIGVVDRYDFESQNEFSIVCFEAKDKSQEIIKRALSKILRQSDAISSDGDTYYLLLPHTSTDGAVVIMKNISEFLGEESRNMVISYPKDGLSLNEISSKLESFK